MTASDLSCSSEQCYNEEVPTVTLNERIRKVAFQHLLETHQAVSVDVLIDELGEPREKIDGALSKMDRQGLIRRNQSGKVVGSVGLSIEPSRHELFIGDQQFWTWCAYDAVGILAALGTTGRVLSKSPLTGAPIDLRFRDGSPEQSDTALFLPDDIVPASDRAPSPAEVSPYDDWCPLANLFENREASLAWAKRHRVRGQILSLTEAAARGARHWQPVVPTPPVLTTDPGA